ncbi:MAG: tyrosine-type recombinase/integrase [Candidatus Paceibacteria bacterium]
MAKLIKESVSEIEFKKLMAQVRGDLTLKENTKNNLLRTFTLLYYTGSRLNELLQLTNSNILEIFKNNELIIKTHKTKNERKIYFSEQSVKDLKKLFLDIENEEAHFKIIRSKGKPYQSPHNITFIQQVNKYMKNLLGDRYSSHSFRQGLITEMATKGINTKIIKEYIGHSDIKTTLRYVKPSKVDIRNSLVR